MLKEKHKHHLKKLWWDASLGGSNQQSFTSGAGDSTSHGVCLPDRSFKPTPHNFFVDDDIYSIIFDSYQIQQAVVARIKAIYILLGNSDLTTW